MTPIDIPIDLQIETLLRLPVKSLLRFKCVSKLWSSIITSRDFKNRHINIATSSVPPRLLIAFADFDRNYVLLVSSPNPTAYSSSSSPCCVPYRDLSLVKLRGKEVYNACRGLICVGAGFKDVAICNPGTRQLYAFPEFKFKDSPQAFPRPNYVFGYDPVEDQYKVLAADVNFGRFEHKVVALGREEAWREVPCVACPHVAFTSGLYMNGTVYYGAYREAIDSQNINPIIMSFDVRLETFNMINIPSKVLSLMGYVNMGDAHRLFTGKALINYREKIGLVENPHEGSFRLWIVEDAEKEEWSMQTFHLPESALGLDLKVTDTVNNGEICLVPKDLSDPFCLFFYNLDKKSMRSVVIEGLPISEFNRPYGISVTVSDHHESFMFLETPKLT
ncbi:unnamed protein product [Microthlaspi erraticum]|uniref:F-box domain-containing protein n=1 Tax=Microthlaspi erraticum TaxID=1685480 RepID=A0A6D2J6L5_9BRAS|nr:unnamed protein product [Microthlaspi erraticum]